LGWTIGFLEGEGSFVTVKSGKEGVYPRVVGYQNTKDVLERLQKWFGGNIYTYSTKYMWQLDSIKATKLANLLLPFMTQRRQDQIKKILDSEKRVGNRNAAKTHCIRGHKFDGINIHKGYIRRYCKECHRFYKQREKERSAGKPK
jgi:hypothetical protein